jgi:hypothetical protein
MKGPTRAGRATCAALLAAALTTALTASQQPAGPPPEADRTAVIGVVQQLFDAMAARSTEQALRLVVPEGQMVAVRDDKGIAAPRPRTLQAFAEALAGQKSSILERMWNPDVQVHGVLATLTTRYDFHQDGKFTHCGTDVFNLVKTAEGWKVASGIYTVERTGCAPSPLGPPK